jgi:F-type H+-transporting ATPase subunit a
VQQVLAAAEWGGDFDEAFENIGHLFDFPAIVEFSFFGLFDLSINRTILIAWFMTLVIVTIFYLGTRDAKVVPGKLQSLCESIVDFVRGIAVDIIGPRGHTFLPFLTTLFVLIFFLNIAKITPLMMMPPTSRIAWPLTFALASWLVYVGVGLKEHGFSYIKDMVLVPGVPKLLLVILAPIELVSNLVLRPFTLAVRLFANMVAGHILVVITLVTVHVFLPSASGFPLGIAGLIASPLVFGFELFIIGLQAYIFTMLTAVYISSSLEAAH